MIDYGILVYYEGEPLVIIRAPSPAWPVSMVLDRYAVEYAFAREKLTGCVLRIIECPEMEVL